MISLYVGITDWGWYQHLSQRSDLAEVNFWQPGGNTSFKALVPGELFLFKLHAPRNYIAGGAVFSHATSLPLSLAWEAFGPGNGAASLAEMRTRIAKYREQRDDPRAEYMIGCRLLVQPFFFDENDWIPVPASWAPQTQVGKIYRTDSGDGRWLWDQVQQRLEKPLT
ncbi:MAG: HNH endonuclease, partial [Rhodospirillales bacterium]|nr:HNH endonuclease [Rhodospirillales bacterium]